MAVELVFTPVSVLRMIGKQVLSIVLSSVGLMITGAAIVYFLPDLYRAESLILVEQQKIPERLVESTVQVELQDRLATISQQIMSGTQLQKIIDKHNLYRDQRTKVTPEELIESMRKNIEIKTEKGWTRNRPGAFRVFFKSTDSQQSATVTNELANLFIEENLKSREVQAIGATEFLGAQLEEARKRLLEQESKLSDFKKRNSGQLPGHENGLLLSLTQLQTQSMSNNDALSRAQGNKSILESELRSAETSLQHAAASIAADMNQAQQAAQAAAAQNAAGGSGGSGGSEQASGGASTQAKPSRSEQLDQMLEQMKRRYTDQHPQVRALRAELDRVRIQEAKDRERELAARRVSAPKPAAPPVTAAAVESASNGSATPASGTESSTPRLSTQSQMYLEQQRERVEKLRGQLQAAVQEINTREQEKARLDRELARNQDVLAKLPIAEQEMISISRDYEVSKKAYETLLQKSYTANTAEDLERRQKSERFTVLDVARPPEKPYQPNRPVLYTVAVVLSIVLGILVGIGLEFKKNVVLGEWELPPDVWLLGRIPLVPPAASGTSNFRGLQ
jgi:succinoglycan biosynthesis transport protein ExoP